MYIPIRDMIRLAVPCFFDAFVFHVYEYICDLPKPNPMLTFSVTVPTATQCIHEILEAGNMNVVFQEANATEYT